MAQGEKWRIQIWARSLSTSRGRLLKSISMWYWYLSLLAVIKMKATSPSPDTWRFFFLGGGLLLKSRCSSCPEPVNKLLFSEQKRGGASVSFLLRQGTSCNPKYHLPKSELWKQFIGLTEHGWGVPNRSVGGPQAATPLNSLTPAWMMTSPQLQRWHLPH